MIDHFCLSLRQLARADSDWFTLAARVVIKLYGATLSRIVFFFIHLTVLVGSTDMKMSRRVESGVLCQENNVLEFEQEILDPGF